jgi:hypothetical protein
VPPSASFNMNAIRAFDSFDLFIAHSAPRVAELRHREDMDKAEEQLLEGGPRMMAVAAAQQRNMEAAGLSPAALRVTSWCSRR